MLRRAVFGLLLVVMAPGGSAKAQDCASLAKLSLADTTIVTADSVTSGTVTPPYGDPVSNLPAFCRVVGVLHPTADSHIRFEVWLPEKNWNHRFVGTGNGGFAGSIYYAQMAGNVRNGYATAGGDAGHQANAEDASWAYHHPEKIVDFGYRGLHLVTLRARTITGKFYGDASIKAYFDGCSDGGREALMEAQRFPADYDGILAGAPANNWTHLLAAGVDESKTLVGDPAGYISSLKLPAITAAVLAQCDAQDGLKDGILNDPRMCRFDPSTLLCRGEDELSCLTAPEVASLKKIYAGGVDSEGHLIFPGLLPGDEAGAWKAWVVGEAPGASNYLQNFFRYMVYNDPSWNALTANVDDAVRDADAKTGAALNATNPDLGAFVARGGKLIMYQGWNDPAISPLNTVAYYGEVVKALGAERARDSVRLYMVPGMEHCLGGPGPSAFGQLGLPAGKSGAPGALTALEAWVENGTGPAELTAMKFPPKAGAAMTRPICPYPESTHYKGSGDPADASSFTCEGGGTAR